MAKKAEKKSKLSKYLPYILVVCSLLGLLASFMLTYDKIQVLKNPNYDPACNINPIFSCGSVMKTEQASLLGVPNTIFGLMGFTALLTFSILLAAKTKFDKWIWQAAQAASILGVIFMHYLFFQGVFRINAICPWCFLTWIVTIPIFIFLTSYNLESGNITLPSKYKKLVTWITNNSVNILIFWYTAILLILLQHFWYYWQTLL